VEYKKGRENMVVDALSRRDWPETNSNDSQKAGSKHDSKGMEANESTSMEAKEMSNQAISTLKPTC